MIPDDLFKRNRIFGTHKHRLFCPGNEEALPPASRNLIPFYLLNSYTVIIKHSRKSSNTYLGFSLINFLKSCGLAPPQTEKKEKQELFL